MRKILSFSMILVLLFATSVFSSSQYGNQSGDENIDYESIMEMQANAVEANNILWDHFEFRDSGEPIFPEEYAGCWISGNKLVIALNTEDKESKNKYCMWTVPFSDSIQFEFVKYSMSELTRTCSLIIDELSKKTGIQINEYYIDPKKNQICLGVNENELEACNEFVLSEIHVPVCVYSGKGSTTTTTSLLGSNIIYNSNAGCSMSLGICGTYEGAPIIITCGHGGQAYGDAIKFSGSNGASIGSIIYHRYYNHTYGDFEIIALENSNFDTTNKITNNISITQTDSNPPVDTVVKYHGGVSNVDSYGIITATGMTVIASPATNVHGLSRISLASGNCISGDSGSAIYRTAHSQNIYCGILHGFSSTEQFSYVYFTPYVYPQNEFYNAKTN